MKSQSFQDKLDIIIEKVFLWAIPEWVKPNWLTYFRILTVPIIGYLLHNGNIKSAFILFIVSVSSDFLDGTIARRRNKITDLGKVLDPIADKMLIATILIYIGFEYLIIKIFLIFIIFEIISVIFGSVLAYKIGRPVGANIYGKIKMVLQSLSVGTFLIGIFLNNKLLITGSVYVLSIALFFAVLAGIEVYRKKRIVLKKHFKNFIRSI